MFKTKLIYRLDIKKMLFVKLWQAIANYIYYYNNVRIQKKSITIKNTKFEFLSKFHVLV
ncbi:hypothetical protein II941_03085 [bacterium]|nr:hypothetical protein [bacterium]